MKEMSSSYQSSSRRKHLLQNLRNTVEYLLASQVSNLWTIYGGLSRLHRNVNCIMHDGVTGDGYWDFVQGLNWLQPSHSMSTVALDSEYKCHYPDYIRDDLASTWLYHNLENHSLSKKLTWLFLDAQHILQHYARTSFLAQHEYREALVLCLRAAEQMQLSFLADINPYLFLKDIEHSCTSQVKLDVLTEDDSPSGPNRISTDVQQQCAPEKISTKANAIPSEDMSSRHAYTGRTPQRFLVTNDVIEHKQANSRRVELSKSLPVNAGARSRSLAASKSPEYSFLDSLGGVAGEKDYRKFPRKTFIEDDGGVSVLPMCTGYFPKPLKGQSLTSFLVSSQFARANAELDRENAHFCISEAIISAIEQLKCRNMPVSLPVHSNVLQSIRVPRSITSKGEQSDMENSFLSDSYRYISSNSESEEDSDIDEACNLPNMKSRSMSSLFSDVDLTSPRGAPDGASDVFSAESVALSLIGRFNQKHLPRASDLEWLVSEEDAPQQLLPLPKSFPVSPDDCDEIPKTPLRGYRGTNEWAPPRPQIIFTLHPQISRSILLAKQNYRCAGCGTRVAPQYAQKYRKCTYLGRYFCTGCHTNQLSIIPANIFQNWDFSKYRVSTFSYRLLEQMHTDPIFRVFEINKSIAKQSGNLTHCRKYRLMIYYLKDYILTCRFAQSIVENLSKERPHIVNENDVYSLEDLVSVKTGELVVRLKNLVDICCKHIANCNLCKARGFVCELCGNPEIIFPWDVLFVSRCPKCGECFHMQCWDRNAPCVRCERYTKRRQNVQV